MKLYNTIDKEELKRRMEESSEPRLTLSFYRYQPIEDPDTFRDQLYRRWVSLGVLGRIYVATEGINAQISVPEASFEEFRSDLYSLPGMDGLRLNLAIEDNGKSFYKLKIKVRPKIVADGLDDSAFDPSRRGSYLDAEGVNEMIKKEDALVVDMRNHYESEVGHFEGAICPDVETFREALPLVEEMLEDKKDKDIVLYCTGGIRCEKASAYYRHRGFEKVYMVEGGIIEYARQCADKGLPNKFIGKNFVFDERMGESISGDVIAQCHQCGAPCDVHVNCANDACHLLFIQCSECAEKYSGCCSEQCSEFIALSAEEQEKRKAHTVFNGSRFGKGRFGKNMKSEGGSRKSESS